MLADFIEQEDWSGSIYMWITSGIWVTNANIWINFLSERGKCTLGEKESKKKIPDREKPDQGF